MVITNTTKIFIRNVGLVWRILFYTLLCVLVVGGIAVAVCFPLLTKLSDAGFFNELAEVIGGSFGNVRLDQVFTSIGELIGSLGHIIMQNLGDVLLLSIILLVIINVLGGLLMGLSEMAIADCLYGYMGSNSKSEFLSCFVKNLGKSIKLQLAKLLINIPINFIIGMSIYACLLLSQKGNVWLDLLAPTLCILVVVLIGALKSTFFCAWTPSVIVHNNSVWKGFADGLSGVSKNFGKIYSRQVVIYVCYIAINIASIVLTACVGLIFTIPACILFGQTLGMVIYFYVNGLRFYVDNDEIYSPKKKEDWEPVQDLRYIV